MSVKRNVQFTKLIKAGGRLREFNFRRSEGLKNPLFTVDVADERGNRLYLLYRRENAGWLIQSSIPELWIEEVLPQIQEYLNNYD
jgi:hypothetical protein